MSLLIGKYYVYYVLSFFGFLYGIISRIVPRKGALITYMYAVRTCTHNVRVKPLGISTACMHTFSPLCTRPGAKSYNFISLFYLLDGVQVHNANEGKVYSYNIAQLHTT